LKAKKASDRAIRDAHGFIGDHVLAAIPPIGSGLGIIASGRISGLGSVLARPLHHAPRSQVPPDKKPCRASTKSRLVLAFRSDTITAMDNLVINVSWEYFLGILGSLIAIAYYTNGRFNALETDVGWLRDTISQLLIDAENVRTKLFKNGSPVALTATGYHVLQRSGLKSYIDAKRQTLLSSLNAGSKTDPYELQCRAFRLLADLAFEDIVTHHLNTYAFANGISTDLLRRIGAIYLRDIAVESN
jgi:hypothetical protein